MELNFDEEFKDCPDNPFLQVSQYGIVRKKNGEILKRGIYKGKYFIVEDPSKKRPFELVHRLVALTWSSDTYISISLSSSGSISIFFSIGSVT